MADSEDAARRHTAVNDYRKKLLQHKELDARVRSRLSLNTQLYYLLLFLFYSLNSGSYRSEKGFFLLI